MPSRTSKFRSWTAPLALFLCLLVHLVGCEEDFEGLSKLKLTRDDKPNLTVPLHVKNTISEYAVLFGGGDLPLQAHGIVIGLGDNGSAEVPAHLRKLLTEYLLKQNLGSAHWGTTDISPGVVLRDKDTSVVLVGGSIPQGAPEGTRFDVFAASPPQTQTRSLDGGRLMPVEMRLAFGGMAGSGKLTHVHAWAGGAVFVNPFVDPTEKSQSVKQRIGGVIGGGEVSRSRQIRLQLLRPDYQMANLIQRRINERWTGDEKVANAKNRSVIELRIPSKYAEDYDYFLDLVMHLPVRTEAGDWEAQAREIAVQMELPAADHNSLALVWEAMGRQIVPIAQTLYTSDNPAAAFHAARAGMRLGDSLATDVIVRFATSANSPHQIAAIEELARRTFLARASHTLRRLVDDANELVRIAAYEALAKRRDRAVVTSIDISGEFKLDLVKSSRCYTIYATQSEEPKIVLFGKDMPVIKPVFFETPDELVTVNALSGDEKLTVFRKVPRSGMVSDPFEIDPQVRALVETLGSRPEFDDDGNIAGLGLTYSQVVGVLYRMCNEKDIPAKFVLQQIPEMQRIYRGAATVGRPDM